METEFVTKNKTTLPVIMMVKIVALMKPPNAMMKKLIKHCLDTKVMSYKFNQNKPSVVYHTYNTFQNKTSGA